jgi:ATP/maltotriose-dependent transcriptional regulator MalT
MNGSLLTSVAAGLLGVLVAAPAFAHQCPKLVAQINAAAGNRFDQVAAEAKAAAVKASALHQQGKHDESEAVAKEALAKVGQKM